MQDSLPVEPVACIVIPCFNEAARLDRDALLALVADGALQLLFVDDGSTDGTGAVLSALEAASDRIGVLRTDRNRGKAEAVRQGLVAALGGTAPLVGYYDADLATPPEELVRLIDTLREHAEVECVLGARVALLGTSIQRRAARHYAGRLFASAASAALGVRVYDTQCGAKVFRRNAAFVAATERPFRSRWAFDVELLDRLLRGTDSAAPIGPETLLEVPLHAWRDVGGSRLGMPEAMLAVLEVARIGIRRRLRTRAR